MRPAVIMVLVAIASVGWGASEMSHDRTVETCEVIEAGRSHRDAAEKWSQLPDLAGMLWSSYWNYNQQVLYQCADDFHCSDGSAIVVVEWWGVDMAWEIDHFEVSFYADLPGPPFAQPGAQLSSYWCTEFTEEDLPGGWGTRYTVDLPVAFQQEAGTTYWISIVAYVREGWTHAAEWYWFACVHEDCWNSDAVQRSSYALAWVPIDDDLAFALYAEEGSAVAITSWSHVKSLFR